MKKSFTIDYDPLKAGSIDGTDTNPHDRGIVRAMNAKYKPNLSVDGDHNKTIFVSNINPRTDEDTLWTAFRQFGKIEKCRLVRDIVTGFSKGYGFIEYEDLKDAVSAHRRGFKIEVDNAAVFVDFECERKLTGWIPRRLGGGLGGNKKSGQLRFGGRERPFLTPIFIRGQGAVERMEGKMPDDEGVSQGRYGRDNRVQDSRYTYNSDCSRRDDRRDRRRDRSRSRDRNRHSERRRRSGSRERRGRNGSRERRGRSSSRERRGRSRSRERKYDREKKEYSERRRDRGRRDRSDSRGRYDRWYNRDDRSSYKQNHESDDQFIGSNRDYKQSSDIKGMNRDSIDDQLLEKTLNEDNMNCLNVDRIKIEPGLSPIVQPDCDEKGYEQGIHL